MFPTASKSCLLTVLPSVFLVLACAGGGGDTPSNDPSSVCANVDCGADGRCVVDGSQPACLCGNGTVAEGLSCIQVADADPCAPNPCQELGQTRCVTDGSAAVCLCDAGRVLVDGACIVEGPCAPNPCTAAFQTVCRSEGAEAVCLCDPGHVALEGGGCSEDPAWDCDKVHVTGVPDPFEPDECPLKANPLGTADAPQDGHTLNPTGDVDWFRVDPEPGHVYRIQVEGKLNLAVYVDAYRSDGTIAVAADHRGTSRAEVFVKAVDAGPLFVRVKALRASDVGAYTITGADLGADDFGDTANVATAVQTGAAVDGHVQFQGDQDVFKIALVPGEAHRVGLEWSGEGEAVLELLTSDGSTVKHRLIGAAPAVVTLARGQSFVFVRVGAHTPWARGEYTLSTAALGPDDHGDVAAEATPLLAGKTPKNVSFERGDDNDVLSFSAVEGRIYAVTCSTANGYGYVFATLEDASGAVLAQQSQGSALLVAHEATETGTLFVRLRNQYQQSHGATYGCTLADLGTDDHGDVLSDATVIAPSGTSRGAILEEPGDKDVFSFTPVQGRVYRFDCTFNNSKNPCALRLLSAGGASLLQGTNIAWEFTTGGVHAFEVSASYSGHGSYTYTLLDLGLDDTGDDISSATPVVVDGLVRTGHLETTSDKDVFSFTAAAGRIYQFTCTPQANASCALKMIGPSGIVVGSAGSNGNGIQTWAHEVDAPGTHYVEVRTSGSGLTGYYTWTLKDLGVDDHGDDLTTASAIAPGTSQTGTFEFSGDSDTFVFTATADRVYRIRCSRGTTTDCGFQLTEDTGTVLLTAQNSYGTQPVEAGWEATTTGPRVIHLGASAVNSYSKPVGSYTISVTDLGVDDHGDTSATATAITMPMSASSPGQIEANGDVDVFSFDAVKDQIYRFTCTAGSLSQCVVKARDLAGAVINGSTYNASEVSFLAAATGTYTVEVTSGSYGAGTGTYSWILQDAGTDDHANTVSGATPLAGTTPVSGQLQYTADSDVFSFPVTAGHIHQIACAGQNSSACQVRVITAANVTVAQGYPTASFSAPATGTLYAIIQGNSSGSALSYSVTVQDLGADDHGDTAATASPMVVGTSASGTVQYVNDVDAFSIALTGGVAYTLSVSANPGVDVRIVSPTGGYVAWTTSSTTFTPPSSANYIVLVDPYASSYVPASYTILVK